jgi:ribosomal protein S18 acetylase RimI-like enzyme
MLMNITYRLMTIEDYSQAYALWLLCGNGLNDKDDSKEGIEKYLKRNPTTSFIAVDGEKIVGVILCGHDGRRGIIQHACVSPDYRRYGIGKKLVDLALEALKDEGINKVLLVAFKKNAGGNAFWEAQGFTLREDLNYRNKALAEMVRIDPDYIKE